jgi:hypothetical protein
VVNREAGPRRERSDNLIKEGINVAQILTAYGIASDVIGVPVTSDERGRSRATESDEFHTLEGTRTGPEVETIFDPENVVPPRRTKRERQWV